MKVSKTQFMNLIRCDRYAALNEIYHDKSDAVVSFSDDVSLEYLMSLENKQSKNAIMDSMFDDDLDLFNEDNVQLDMMMPYYNKLEELSGHAIENKFSGNIFYDLDTYNQKSFGYLKDGFTFYCFLDGYQEDDDVIRIFETKATTSSKFSGKNFSYNDNKEKKDFFVELPSGIYIPAEDVSEVNKDYYKKEKQLMDPYNPRGKYVYDLAYQRFVFENTYKTTKKVEYYLVILNNDYVYDGRLDSDGNIIYDDSIVRFYNLTTVTKKIVEKIELDSQLVIDRINQMDARPTKLGKYCERGKTTQCPFYDLCYKDFPKTNSIFAYKERHHGFKDENGVKHDLYDLINTGHLSVLDVPKSYLNRPKNVIQRNVVETKKPYFNVNKIRAGIGLLRYPIYHLDFESFNPPLPRFKGEKAYTQSLFQYSVHVEKEPGVCDFDKDHFEYLSKNHHDNRLELLESLLDVIKDDGGSVLVYNVSFERSRLRELQEYFPQYFNELENIIERLFDLQHIVESNGKLYEELGFSKEEAGMFNFYDERLNGSFSIKYVLPIFSNLRYENLEVSNGMEAMSVYANYNQMNEFQLNEAYTNLVNYCKQDTWAMVEILNELRSL